MAQMTKGSEALRAIAEKKTQLRVASELSKKLGRTIRQGSVTGWVNGLHTPSGDVIAALSSLYGIDVELWFRQMKRATRTGTDG